MLELDCHLTKDKKVVVLHDRSLLRVTGCDKHIKELDYDQLPLLKTSISIDFEPGKKKINLFAVWHFTCSQIKKLFRKILQWEGR